MIGSAKCQDDLSECSLHTPHSLLFSGHSLKCFFCASSSSWDDCKTQKITCESSADARCYKAYVKTKLREDTYTVYERGCLTEALCKTVKTSSLCKGKEDCQVNCCSGDLCNTAATKVVSAVFLVLCAFLASVMIQ
ncbi:hypothetical protein P5673_011193 [Acropora cervicornis]|uniref:UPAR/Ly6 domain-containing protein n=1 Tax=Acropora cervicornis TaxID=6130 RepID=A0AAD9QPS8_ACRCE|nr:hypothetical protein P5673_011193 [Acropora cervicornis]